MLQPSTPNEGDALLDKDLQVFSLSERINQLHKLVCIYQFVMLSEEINSEKSSGDLFSTGSHIMFAAVAW